MATTRQRQLKRALINLLRCADSLVEQALWAELMLLRKYLSLKRSRRRPGERDRLVRLFWAAGLLYLLDGICLAMKI